MITHVGMMKRIDFVKRQPPSEKKNQHGKFCFLPLAHVMQMMILYQEVICGNTLVLYQGDSKKILNVIGKFPTGVMLLVPRILNRIYNEISSRIAGAGRVARFLFTKGLAAKRERILQTNNCKHAFWDKVIFNRIRDAMAGGEVWLAGTGSAPISPEVQIAMSAILSTRLINGYAMSETLANPIFSEQWDLEPATTGGPNN